MMSRDVAAIFGLTAGIAAALFTLMRWNRAVAGTALDMLASAGPASRLAWVVATSVSIFALVTLVAAAAVALAETWRARARLDALRHDPSLAGWSAADWRATFAGTAVADHAEAIIAAILPHDALSGDSDRRVFADPALLLNLERVWLDRATLAATMRPLPAIVLAIGILLALLRYANGGPDWAIPLAAGVAGWTAITVARYLIGVLIAPAIELAVRSATAAVRPLTPALALDIALKRLTPDREAGGAEPNGAVVQLDAGAVARALYDALAEPLFRIADAADRLQSLEPLMTGPSSSPGGERPAAEGSVDIEAALAEIRAGIERLLAAPSSAGVAPDLREVTDAIRGALAEQTDTLRQSAQALRTAVEQIADSLAAILASSGVSEGRNTTLVADLVATLERLAADKAERFSEASAGNEPVEVELSGSGPALADELKTLLRNFGDR